MRDFRPDLDYSIVFFWLVVVGTSCLVRLKCMPWKMPIWNCNSHTSGRVFNGGKLLTACIPVWVAYAQRMPFRKFWALENFQIDLKLNCFFFLFAFLVPYHTNTSSNTFGAIRAGDVISNEAQAKKKIEQKNWCEQAKKWKLPTTRNNYPNENKKIPTNKKLDRNVANAVCVCFHSYFRQNGKVYVPIIRIYVRMHLPSDIKNREYRFNQPKFIVSTPLFARSTKKRDVRPKI